MGARDVRELDAYKLCEELMLAVEAATGSAPARRSARFCEQINDAALDAASDISEGFARYYPAEFARFLDYALSSLAEVRRRGEAGYRRGLFSTVQTSSILHLCARADRAIRGLRAYLWTVKKEDLPPRPVRPRLPHPQRPRRGGEATAPSSPSSTRRNLYAT